MRICVIGLDGLSLELIFCDERLVNLRRLLDAGLFGKLASPPHATPALAWISFATSRDPRSFGTNAPATGTDLSSVGDPPQPPAIWDLFTQQGKNSIIVGVLPSASRQSSIAADESFDAILRTSREQWEAAHRRMSQEPWDCFQFVDSALQRAQCEPTALADYCLWLDAQIGLVLERVDEHTIFLLVSIRGAEHSADETEGMFALAAANCPLNGEYEGATLLDLAPTLLDLAGYDIPSAMQGRSLVAGMEKKSSDADGDDNERLLRDRLAGLGYI